MGKSSSHEDDDVLVSAVHSVLGCTPLAVSFSLRTSQAPNMQKASARMMTAIPASKGSTHILRGRRLGVPLSRLFMYGPAWLGGCRLSRRPCLPVLGSGWDDGWLAKHLLGQRTVPCVRSPMSWRTIPARSVPLCRAKRFCAWPCLLSRMSGCSWRVMSFTHGTGAVLSVGQDGLHRGA